MEASEARQHAKHEGSQGPLTREQGAELYARLDDAGLDVRLTRVQNEHLFDGVENKRTVVEVEPDSIKSVEHLRLLADQAERWGIPVVGIYSRLRLG